MYEQSTLQFDGSEWIKFQRTCDISNTFTYEFWVKAEEEQALDEERNTGADGTGGRAYLVGPDFYPEGSAGCGISVGTNGIAVYEHSVNHLPARLVFAHDFSEWQHVAVVSDNKKLRLYINGARVKEESMASNVERVIPSLGIGGHQYGTFKGQVREFRLWSVARSEEEIGTHIFSALDGDEGGLYFYRDPARGVAVSGGTPRNFAVSVIIPSYNRCPLNYFSLMSLERQQFPLQQMEVVFLDDGSTDHTPSLYYSLYPEFPFIYVQQLKSRGRSRIRNIGSGIATGRTLLFVDAEMICGPDFVMTHVNHHQSGERNIVSGAMRSRRIYTMTDPGYSAQQKSVMSELYSGNPITAPIIEQFMQGDQTPVQLLPFELMFDPDHLNRWSSKNDYFDSILQTYGSKFKLFQYSWLNLITNNLSMTKRFFDEIGGFDEALTGFGWEDWEFGYRAARKGAVFIHDDAVINYHQEHPISPENTFQSRSNYLKFCDKNPQAMEIKLFALTMVPDWVTLSDLNDYLMEYNKIKAIYKDRFKWFHRYLERAIDLLLEQLRQTETITLPIAPSVLRPEEETAVREDVAAIRELDAFPKLLEMFERVSKYYY
ncbi:glycosyltransferase involved in cell wall biosynthesis [Paenibacillus forsythiae]|uniref:Glycosyltransferase involved in cell wall biosynthesis n=1 Tax=Paenibacillus forsythiae TaxID=365616 RepID=A0ABU3HC26_9BACL|nr:LamG-like jellyroll fold domain-containing protein [Paenibacillus forsythiae]MDT3428367.1 glycosyltransferase involved in cell wall biosynthesis [Paenibacillus forsythiae]